MLLIPLSHRLLQLIPLSHRLLQLVLYRIALCFPSALLFE